MRILKLSSESLTDDYTNPTICKIKPCYVVNADDSFKFIGYIIRVNDHIEDNTIYLDYEVAYEYAKEKGYKIT